MSSRATLMALPQHHRSSAFPTEAPLDVNYLDALSEPSENNPFNCLDWLVQATTSFGNLLFGLE